ncbi:MAG: class I SAM-dependent methyltransferase [Anaerolineae bacterium]|nr:class I SAM-dependent methyltransferase [Anaerolineae bacterium]
MTTTPAFDPAAHDYDAEFTDQLLGQWLRECVWKHTPFTAPMHILELGCGTGEDARHFAEMGMSVLATDASGEMIAVAKAKNPPSPTLPPQSRGREQRHANEIPPLHVMGRGLGGGVDNAGGVSFMQLDLNTLPNTPLTDTPFDAVFSNFGVINCVENRAELAKFIHQHLKPHGTAVIVTMTRTCPIEIFWHLLHLRPKQAVRRFFGGRLVHVGNGGALRVWYPSHAELRRDFARAGLRLERMVGIGVTLPPSYLAPLVAKYPRFWGFMRRWEHRLARFFPFNRLNDHTLMVFRRD